MPMPWKTALQFCRNLVSHFNHRQMDRFDAATNPADIDRYQTRLAKVLAWITVVVVLVALSISLAILLKA
jgi:hypothetical protein